MTRDTSAGTVRVVRAYLMLLACAIPAWAQTPAAPAGLGEWRPLPVVPGGQIMLLVGNPGKHEPFVFRVRYPANSPVIPPHWHNITYHFTMLRGTLVLGMGDKIDSSAVTEYGPGSFVQLEGGMHHFEWWRDEVEAQIEGVGPLYTIFLNPADDPRGGKRPSPFWLSLGAYKGTLAGTPPVTVVFDIDDTALFSSYAMVAGERAFRARYPKVKDPYADCRLFGAVNDSLDARYSRPKAIAMALIGFHQERGDRIVFITKRCASTPANDSTARLLARTFHLRAVPVVRFTNLKDKVAAIAAERPAISYGDSDSDIEDTMKAAARMPGGMIRAVRIVRSPLSSNTGPQTPGKFGEEILADSDQ